MKGFGSTNRINGGFEAPEAIFNALNGGFVNVCMKNL